LYQADAAITAWINSWANLYPALDTVMIWTSTAGVPLLILAVAVQWWSKDERIHTRHVLLATGFSFLLGLGINQLILLFVHRVRPYDVGISKLLMQPSTDPSFPSDHSTAAFAITFSFLLFGFNRRGLAFLAAAGLIAVSRIYVGTHYVSDVIGGAATAVLATVLVSKFYTEGNRLDRILTSIL
jgi:undecaprenyl-diphosphatase